MCFRNAAHYCWGDHTADYYEGYTMSDKLLFPILHAWNVEDGLLVDTTLANPEDYQYLGMKFDQKIMLREQLKNKVYGILDIGVINIDLLREIDNDLVEEALRTRTENRPCVR